ncbi:MAG: hypothetical protein ABII22_00145 [Candidatus Micrarchaeota archaeon]
MFPPALAIDAKMKAKSTAGILKALQPLGFSKIEVTNEGIVAEKMLGDESLDYKIVFKKNGLLFFYSLQPKVSNTRRMLELFPVLLSLLVVVSPFYDASPRIYDFIIVHLKELEKVIDKDAVDVSLELNGIKSSYESLNRKYEEVLRSGEQNARILLEYESKNEELRKRIAKLESVSDEVLKEEMYKWIKLHNGSIDVSEFCKAFNVASARAEEALSTLAKEGYIKRSS